MYRLFKRLNMKQTAVHRSRLKYLYFLGSTHMIHPPQFKVRLHNQHYEAPHAACIVYRSRKTRYSEAERLFKTSSPQG